MSVHVLDVEAGELGEREAIRTLGTQAAVARNHIWDISERPEV
jgi:hypothetical protein